MPSNHIFGMSILPLLLSLSLPAAGDDVLLHVDDVPPHGLAVGRVDLTDALRWCHPKPVEASSIRAELLSDGTAVPIQLVGDVDYHPENHVAGTVILKLPSGGSATVRLQFNDINRPSETSPFDGTVETDSIRVVHDVKKMGGLPSRFEFVATGKVFERFRWNDRLHDPQRGGFSLSNDPEPLIERVSAGPLVTVVRVRARYIQSPDRVPESQPEAVYDWCYFNNLPLIRVTATASQRPAEKWNEAHFLELNFPGDDFPNWAGGEPLKTGPFKGETRSFPFNTWGALVDGHNAIAMLDCGRVLFYDHQGGSYIHAHGDKAWRAWTESERSWSAWLWIGATEKIDETIRAARAELPTRAKIRVVVASIDSRIQAARQAWLSTEGPERRQTWWQAAGAARLADAARFDQAIEMLEGRKPDRWTILDAGELGAILERGDQGISLLSLFDTVTGRELLSPSAEPLFELTLRNAETKEEVRATADIGWREVEIVAPDDPQDAVVLRWKGPTDERLGPVEVVARVTPDATTGSLEWQLTASSGDGPWAIWRTVFPMVAVGRLGGETSLFFPHAAGQVADGAARRDFNFSGRYPRGWTTMQYMAVYADDGSGGLYVAVHDPSAGTKEIRAESRAADRRTLLAFDHPVPDMGRPGGRFELNGRAVWRLFRGDWFDAATIYRDWVRREARWYPELTDEGRADTPRWMRELDVWALGGGDPKTGLPMLQEFAREMGVPVGFHWYSWHRIPFDNDYPHYFPADEGFAQAVATLQEKGIRVMPYINGRLWDTRDKESEDFRFTELARPAATKDESGEPYIESYGSKESDGSRVRLAVMCPSTELWQRTVRDIVLRLTDECGVSGVYIDQIAAAQPELCFDPAHGHPLGGGHWWTESYWEMLEAVRREMPDDRILTTECNAEPYIKWFDGYLTWHWQNDGQVPAFPAVYGGSIQMFGRAYRGGPDKDLALRMKAGQQLVFGEQIGWLSPSVVREKENFAFLREIVQMRRRFRSYFTVGEMARPPVVGGDIPSVTADWQWSGEWPVTTSALLTGGWRIPRENRAVLLLVNVSDKRITGRLKIDAADYGISGERVRIFKVDSRGKEESSVESRTFRQEITLPARTATALELTVP